MREMLEALANKLDIKAKYLNPPFGEVYADIATLIREVVKEDRKAEVEHDAVMDQAYNDACRSAKDW